MAAETKETIAQGNTFLYFLPPRVTEALYAIDAGYGQSMRCAVGCLLDNWLMDEDNMALQESEKGMVTADRCVLISKLVAQANEETLKNDEVRISC